jgi:hypothetical protein
MPERFYGNFRALHLVRHVGSSMPLQLNGRNRRCVNRDNLISDMAAKGSFKR